MPTDPSSQLTFTKLVVGEINHLPEQSIRVAFSRDPEGHLRELVEIQA